MATPSIAAAAWGDIGEFSLIPSVCILVLVLEIRFSTLIESENSKSNFDWVKEEYIPLFKQKNPKKGTHAREATARMKKLFAEFPDVRKDEVLKATQNYLLATDADYIRNPHYFIIKGSGTGKIMDILTWIDRLREQEKQYGERFGKSSVMN